jgi:hypothetical protein
MIEKLADVAMSQVGVREVGGNNRGAKIRTYQAASNLKPGPWPWCAAFVDWCVQQWLVYPEARQWLGLKHSTPAGWRPKTALAFGLIEWGQKRPNTVTILPEKTTPKAGDIIVFDFSHTGIVVGATSKIVECVEGNTNGRGTRDSETGDGVWLKKRNLSLARCYLRIHPSKAS